MSVFTSKFVQTLKTFSNTELKSFEQWLNSPWCNSNKNLSKLVEKLKKYYPDFDNEKLTKEKLFKQVLPKGKFSDRRMNNLLSEGYLAAKQFLIFNNLTNNENLQKDLLTQEFQNRHLEDWFFRDTNKEIERLANKEIKDWEDHLDLLRLHRRIYHHPNQNPRMQPGGQTIVKMGEQLDLVYLLEKAAIINEKIFRNRILKNENHNIEKELKLWLLACEDVDHPAIEFYKMRFRYQEETMLEQYFDLRNTFLERYKELNLKEQKVHLISLLNDTILLYRSDLVEITENLPLYKLGLKTKIILHQGIINLVTFRTIVAASNYKKSFDYTHQFIESYSHHLKEEFQTDGINWAKAHTAYWEKNLEKSLTILINSQFNSPYFQLHSRLLTTQVYFDLYLKDYSYQSYLFDYFNSFEKWIIREKFGSEFLKKSYIRFIQKCRTLAKIYSNTNFNNDKFNQVLGDTINVQAIKWLYMKKEEIFTIKNRRSFI